MTHINYFRQNHLRNLKLATLTMIEDHYSWGKLATFKWDRKAKCSYLIYTKQKVLLICNENKEICVVNLMIKYRYFFPLLEYYYDYFLSLF